MNSEVSHAIEQSVLSSVVPDARSKYTPFLEYQIAYQLITFMVRNSEELRSLSILEALEAKSATAEFESIYPLLLDMREKWGDIIHSELFRNLLSMLDRYSLARECFAYLDERFTIAFDQEDRIQNIIDSIISNLKRIKSYEHLNERAPKHKLSFEDEVVMEQFLNQKSEAASLNIDQLVGAFNQVIAFQLKEVISEVSDDEQESFTNSSRAAKRLRSAIAKVDKPSLLTRLRNHCRQRWLEFKRGWKRASKLAKCGLAVLVLLELIGVIVAAVIAPPSVLVTVPGGVLLTTKSVALVGGAMAVMGTVAATKKEMMQPKLRHDGKKELYESLELKELTPSNNHQRVKLYGGAEIQETHFGRLSPRLFKGFSNAEEVIELNCTSPSVMS